MFRALLLINTILFTQTLVAKTCNKTFNGRIPLEVFKARQKFKDDQVRDDVDKMLERPGMREFWELSSHKAYLESVLQKIADLRRQQSEFYIESLGAIERIRKGDMELFEQVEFYDRALVELQDIALVYEQAVPLFRDLYRFEDRLIAQGRAAAKQTKPFEIVQRHMVEMALPFKYQKAMSEVPLLRLVHDISQAQLRAAIADSRGLTVRPEYRLGAVDFRSFAQELTKTTNEKDVDVVIFDMMESLRQAGLYGESKPEVTLKRKRSAETPAKKPIDLDVDVFEL